MASGLSVWKPAIQASWAASCALDPAPAISPETLAAVEPPEVLEPLPEPEALSSPPHPAAASDPGRQCARGQDEGKPSSSCHLLVLLSAADIWARTIPALHRGDASPAPPARG